MRIEPARTSTLTATRLVYLAAGTGMAAWAPIVPFAKSQTGTNAAEFGLLLLCLGAGSILSMPLTGLFAIRFGCKSIILVAGTSLCFVLPLLPLVGTPLTLGVLLFVFGASIGTVDVAMNIQGVLVEKVAGQPLMSGFNAMFSLGGIVGAGGVTLLSVAGLSIVAACGTMSICLAIMFLVASSGLLGRSSVLENGHAGSVRPRGMTLVIGLFCFGLFLCEGAVLDWSAIYLTDERGLPSGIGGIGYAVFSGSMMVGRFAGDRAVQRFGDARVMIIGSLLAALGYTATAFGPSAVVAIAGFGIVGLGLSNMVPILFRAAGKQDASSPGMAIAMVSTFGYAGILVGPALIGVIIEAADFELVLASMALLVLVVAFASVKILRNG
jgi:predicted MFS family arabinose efflux permease